jgi:hypothetical protein
LTIKTSTNPPAEITLDDYNPAIVSSTAYARIKEYLDTVSTNKPVEFEIKAGPSIPKEQIDLERSRIEKSAQFWSASYEFKPIVFVYSGEDADWMVSQLNALGNNFHDNLIRSDYWKKTGECMQSLAVHTNSQPYYINCHRSTIFEGRMSAIAAHEFAHLPITARFQDQPGGVFASTPVWVNEGGAEIFGIALTDQARDMGVTFWHKLHINMPDPISLSSRSSVKLRDLLANITEDEAVELMTSFERVSGLMSGAPYALGKWATELLLANGGMEKYLQFLDAIDPSTDWKTAFERTYGLSLTDFYKQMVPYFHWLAKTH